nr:helix-turn-helix domain-containing protein [uncultured Draconibacterium sp.]
MTQFNFNDVSSIAAVKLEATTDDLMKLFRDVITETTNSIIAKLDEERSPEILTRKEAMKKLDIKSEATMINWEKKGYLSPHRIGGRIFYQKNEVVDALERFTRPDN